MYVDAPVEIIKTVMSSRPHTVVGGSLLVMALKYNMSEDRVRFMMARTPKEVISRTDRCEGRTKNFSPFQLAARAGTNYSVGLIHELMELNLEGTMESWKADNSAY